MLPFVVLSGAAGGLSWVAIRNQAARQNVKQLEKAAEIAENEPTEEPISSVLQMDDLRLELGYGLVPLINDSDNDQLTNQIKALRRQLASEMGFVMPSVRILDNMQLEGQSLRH